MEIKARQKKLVAAVKKMKAAKVRMLRSTASYHRWVRQAEYHQRMLTAETIEAEVAAVKAAAASSPLRAAEVNGRKFR